MVKKFSTDEIVRCIKSSQDREVLNWMYKEVYPKVRRYVTGNSGSVDDSKDVFQEAVIVLYKQVIDNKYNQITDVEGFMIVVSRNIWINMVRKASRNVSQEFYKEEYSLDNNPLVEMIMTEKWGAFQKLFDSIGEKCKELLTFSTYEKLTMDEIAIKMGLANANAAKTQNYRCKQKLIDLVAENKELANSLNS